MRVLFNLRARSRVACCSSCRDEQLHQSSHRVHPVEHAERLTQVHQNEPGAEAEELFPQAVLKLRVGSEGRDDPQLEEQGTCQLHTRQGTRGSVLSDVTLPWCWRGRGKHRFLVSLSCARTFSHHALEQQGVLACFPPAVTYPPSSLPSVSSPFSLAAGEFIISTKPFHLSLLNIQEKPRYLKYAAPLLLLLLGEQVRVPVEAFDDEDVLEDELQEAEEGVGQVQVPQGPAGPQSQGRHQGEVGEG